MLFVVFLSLSLFRKPSQFIAILTTHTREICKNPGGPGKTEKRKEKEGENPARAPGSLSSKTLTNTEYDSFLPFFQLFLVFFIRVPFPIFCAFSDIFFYEAPSPVTAARAAGSAWSLVVSFVWVVIAPRDLKERL